MVNLDILDDNESRHVVEAPVKLNMKYTTLKDQEPLSAGRRREMHKVHLDRKFQRSYLPLALTVSQQFAPAGCGGALGAGTAHCIDMLQPGHSAVIVVDNKV